MTALCVPPTLALFLLGMGWLEARLFPPPPVGAAARSGAEAEGAEAGPVGP